MIKNRPTPPKKTEEYIFKKVKRLRINFLMLKISILLTFVGLCSYGLLRLLADSGINTSILGYLLLAPSGLALIGPIMLIGTFSIESDYEHKIKSKRTRLKEQKQYDEEYLEYETLLNEYESNLRKKNQKSRMSDAERKEKEVKKEKELRKRQLDETSRKDKVRRSEEEKKKKKLLKDKLDETERRDKARRAEEEKKKKELLAKQLEENERRDEARRAREEKKKEEVLKKQLEVDERRDEILNELNEFGKSSNEIIVNKNTLIESIYATIEDYRADEYNPLVRVTKERINTWINQFDIDCRLPILTELDNVLKVRYCSKLKIKNFLVKSVEVLTKDYNFNSVAEFLKNCDFLNLQPDGKSQKIMLSLLDELIQAKYGLSLANCGTTSKKFSIYIDDILCTGLTLISDIKEWSEMNFNAHKTNKQAIADGSTILIFTYLFIHEKNYQKKKAEMKHKISYDVAKKHKMYRLIKIENGVVGNSKIDIIYPVERGQPQNVVNYKNKIIERVDIHTQQWGRASPEEFYRPAGLPSIDHFFKSPHSRIILENAFLQKGVEILQKSNSTNKNMRALGYSIPALKNFGFGALCFTWRNVPNNAPLVFWYSGGGFIPLFKVTRSSFS